MICENDIKINNIADTTILSAVSGLLEIQVSYKQKLNNSDLTDEQKERINSKIWNLETAITAMKKSLPVKLRNMKCLSCGRQFSLHDIRTKHMMYCPDCGQAIDNSIIPEEEKLV